MRPTFAIGILLIVLGIFVIAYDYIPARRETHHFGIGPIRGAVQTEEESDPMPLILGGLSIAAGLYLVLKKS